MSIKQVRNKIMEYIINGNNSNDKIANKVSLESYVNQGNNVEYNYLPFIDFQKNNSILKNKNDIYNDNDSYSDNHLLSASMPLPDDNLTRFYIVGLSCLGLYMLNSVLKKK